MGVTKKATVVAKTATRKVRLSASEVAFAQSQEFPFSEVAKAKLPKRGRPVGSKNKPKAGRELAKLGGSLSSKGFPVDKLPVGATITFEELNNGYVDWETLAKRLQKALAVEMKTVEGMEKLFEDLKTVSTKVSDLTFWQRIKLVVTGKY